MNVMAIIAVGVGAMLIAAFLGSRTLTTSTFLRVFGGALLGFLLGGALGVGGILLYLGTNGYVAFSVIPAGLFMGVIGSAIGALWGAGGLSGELDDSGEPEF